MKKTTVTIIKNPSQKLEEHIRWVGVQKYLRLRKLASDDMPSAKVISV